ncbi:hypothetical protein CFPU101_29080 [Chroococcus sp. FPU101]|nr:hypothetical protein CFPU101_29080 [Chroococcus sp. FPU101]
MLPELYRTSLSNQLSQAQLLTLEILVWLLQVHKQITIEKLAAYFPLPIKYKSLGILLKIRKILKGESVRSIINL